MLTILAYWLNIIGGIIGVIWLVLLAEWQVAIFGVLLVFLSVPTVMSLLFLLHFPTGFLFTIFDRAQVLWAREFVSIIMVAVTLAVQVGWSVAVLWLATVASDPSNSSWPYFLLGYPLATFVWFAIAMRGSKYVGNASLVFSAFALSKAYPVSAISIILFSADLTVVIAIHAAFHLLANLQMFRIVRRIDSA